MTCRQKGCGGGIDTAVSKELISGGYAGIFVRTPFNPCKKCSLLHNLNGMAACQNKEGFFFVNDEVVYREVVLNYC